MDHRKALDKTKLFLYSSVLVIISLVFLGDKSYMVVSFLIMGLALVPFFLSFEGRKPKAREIVLLVSMIALCVTLHLSLSLTFPIQGGSALIFLTGCCLGGEAGFIVGAMARLVCNFYMGHGPWSPWQMMAWGLLGLLGGIIFSNISNIDIKKLVNNEELFLKFQNEENIVNRKVVKKERNSLEFTITIVASVAVFNIIGYLLMVLGAFSEEFFSGLGVYIMSLLGLLFTFVIKVKKVERTAFTMALACFFIILVVYGGLMNLSVIATSSAYTDKVDFSLKALKTIYISGLPYDLFHSFSAALVVYFLGDKIVKRIERVRLKFGIYI